VTVLTGTGAAIGQQNTRGIQMAVDEINAAGGVNGAMIELVTDDTAFDRNQAVSLIRKQASDPGTVAIIGPLSTPELVVGSPVCAEVQIVCLSTGSASVWQGGFNDWTFRNNLISTIAMPNVLQTLKDKLGLKSVAVVYDITNDCSVNEMTAIRDSIANQVGLDLVGVEGYRQGDTDYSAQLTNLLPKKPDLLLVTGTSDQAGLVVQQARQRGFAGEILGGCSDLNDAKVYQLSGGQAKDAITFFPFNPNDPRPVVQNFVKNYKEKYNEDPSNFVATGYDAVQVFADAARRAGTTTDRKAFRDALASTSKVEGVGGTYTFNGSGDNQTPAFYLFRIKDGGGYVPFE
jgi:branched-chain amino acid transport system substrate-binding protein